jgi:AraC-like DNA-binding protein
MKSIGLDNSFFYLVSICLLFIIVCLLVFRVKEGDKKASNLLLGYFTTYLYLIGITYLFIYNNPQSVIHSLRTGHIASLLMPVFAYSYFKQCLEPEKYTWVQLLHLLPAVFFVIDFFPFFLLSASDKISIFQSMSAVEYRIGFTQGMFMPKYGHVIVRMAQLLLYWIAQFLLLQKAKKNIAHPLKLASPFTWRWLHLFLYTQTTVFILPIIGVFVNNAAIETVLFSVGAAGAMAIQCFYLLLHPEILSTATYQTSPTLSETDTNSVISDPKISETSTNEPDFTHVLTAAEMEAIGHTLENYMATKKPFLINRYSLTQLAIDTKISPQKLSSFIHARFDCNFNDYLNKYRINAVVTELEQKAFNAKTLEAISAECGFNSRATFIRAFKKEKGSTPTEFIKSIQ